MVYRVELFVLVIASFLAIGMSQKVDYNWSYIQQFGTDGDWSAMSSDYTGQHLIVSEIYSDNPLLISSDYGSNWVQSNFAHRTAGFVEFSSSSDGQYVTGVTSSELWVSNNYGHNFTNIFNASVSTHFTGVDISGDGVYQYVTVNGGNLWKSTDSGVTFSVINITTVDVNLVPEVMSLMPWASIATSADGSKVYVTVGYSSGTFGSMPTVLYSYDYGVTWGVAYYTVDNFAQIVCSQSGQYVAMYNQNYPKGFASIFVSSDYGKTYNITYKHVSYKYMISGENYLVLRDMSMSGTGETIAVGTQGLGVLISSQYGANYSWYNATTLPQKDQYGAAVNYQAVTMDQTGKYLVTMPSTGACYMTHDYTWEPPSDDKSNDTTAIIIYSVVGVVLGLTLIVLVGIYVKYFYMTGRSITTLCHKKTAIDASLIKSEGGVSSSAPAAAEIDLTKV